ncbi:MAG: tyrosine-type recombinase/integrase [Gaiellaceae bacterium]
MDVARMTRWSAITGPAGPPAAGALVHHERGRYSLQVAELGESTVDGHGARRWKNRYRFHDLRHTAVSRLVAEGADVKLVQAVAGHSKASLTLDRYTHLTDERVREAAKRFDPARSVSRALAGGSLRVRPDK